MTVTGRGLPLRTSGGPEQVLQTSLRLLKKAEPPDIQRSADRVQRVLNVLAPLFLDRDKLLSQQAQIPIIYWLARDIEPSRLSQLRPFLVHFEQARRSNRQKAVDDPTRDLVLFDFEFMARNSNDQSSIAGRYRIARNRFDKFIQTQSVEA